MLIIKLKSLNNFPNQYSLIGNKILLPQLTAWQTWVTKVWVERGLDGEKIKTHLITYCDQCPELKSQNLDFSLGAKECHLFANLLHDDKMPYSKIKSLN